MTLMLNNLEVITVRAFLTALWRLNSPLPSDLQQEVNKVGATYKTNPTAAADELLNLAKHNCLQELYQQARIELQKQYEVQESNKYNSPNQQLQPDSTPPERLSNIAVPILNAPDSVAKAKEHKPEAMQHILPHPI